MEEKENNLHVIKNFSKITIKDVCKENHITYTNLLKGKVTAEKVKIIKEKLIKKIILYLGTCYKDE